MVTFLPSRPGRLADVPSFERAIGGAESNVACALAAAGHTVRWVSGVGADGFGDHLIEVIGGYGVDVSAARRDPARPTGVYFRTAGDRAGDAHEVAYYRAGSAASAMAVGNVDLAAVRAGRVLHLSGITAALSDTCLGLLWELTAPGPNRPLVSFDVNFRPSLWRDADGPRVLLDLARRADIVFVGADEAAAAWGIEGGSQAVRAALPQPRVLVVKHGAKGATLFERPQGSSARSKAVADHRSVVAGRAHAAEPHMPLPRAPFRGATDAPANTDGALTDDTITFVPSLHVDVVAPVGAGDAFAAGFLSATLRELPARDRLRHGHLMAAAALTVPGDLGPAPARDHADRLAASDDETWGTLRLGPGWTTAALRAEEEVHQP
ncbi:sugar kinase [Streptomyces phyllanthi]|uniref:Sugar kinase n=1 Tax=Streptomyces phyllanthi TaxID=1803180 RepID=A0A5N8WA97_9ACTN|nr:sugar kinase [Streptomyces phyllanthi]